VNGWDLGGVALLGVFHGVNPAMGWLFAVAIGMQERSRRALLLALVPIAIGHEAAVGMTVLLVQELRLVASDDTVRLAGAAALVTVALRQILRDHRHPRWVGMRLRPRELALWSFLMSTASGAGLMLLPLVMGIHVQGGHHDIAVSGVFASAAAVTVHMAAMIAVTGTIALLVYEFVGVGILRRGWLNLDRLWAYALGAGAAVTLVVA
jgi:hypothetical protein